MLSLSEIWIYPVKSLGGIRLQHSKITDRGLAYDRRWLLVDDDGRFLSQREFPQLALFQPEIQQDFIRITHVVLNKSIDIKLHDDFSKEDKKILVTVWEDSIQAYEFNKTISIWFSNLLEFSVRLVYMPDESLRKIDTDFAATGTEINSFSDAYPFLIIGKSSLEDLNSRLENPVSINRFRPNFVFNNGKAFEEETWREFSIGKVPFLGVKPCARCIMTTVDQEKGLFSGKEPLKTLAKYRQFGNHVFFGQNVIGFGMGTVSVGDEIFVSSYNV